MGTLRITLVPTGILAVLRSCLLASAPKRQSLTAKSRLDTITEALTRWSSSIAPSILPSRVSFPRKLDGQEYALFLGRMLEVLLDRSVRQVLTTRGRGWRAGSWKAAIKYNPRIHVQSSENSRSHESRGRIYAQIVRLESGDPW